MSYDEIVSKLQKLILKEESCRKIGNLEEAALYAAKIAEWAARYKMDVASLTTEEEREKATKGMGFEVVDPTDKHGHRVVLWYSKIARLVCDYTGCSYCLLSRSSQIIIAGKEVDRQLATYLLKMLCTFIASESQRQYDKQYYLRVEKQGYSSFVLADYKSSWILGAVHTLASRFQEMKEKIEKEREQEEKSMSTPSSTASFALILKKDTDAAAQWLNDTFKPKETAHKQKASGFNGLGYSHGADAAKNISLRRPLNKGAACKEISL